MKLTFKDLKQQKFVIDAEPSETVGQVKEKISTEKGWEASQLKLIYSGKILQDDKTVETYNIEEKGFIVCMVSKPKPAPSAAAPSQAPSTPSRAPATTPAAPPAPAPSAATSTQAAPATPSPATSGAAPPATADTPALHDPSALLAGSQSEPVVAQMESMGFPRDDVNRAMRAAFYNPDRAIEYLLNGIPEGMQQEEQQQPEPTPSAPAAESAPAATAPSGDEPFNMFEAAAQAGGGGGGGGGGGQGAGNQGAGQGMGAGGAGGEGLDLSSLRGNNNFRQLRQIIQQNPAMLEPILQQIAAGSPEIAQTIAQNPEQFMHMLSEEDENPLPPGAHAISVTEEERDAIERLCRLGFERDLVIQAYFACDKNEELTANYLFEHPDDNEE